jgi:periplasmic protein TonB
MATAYAQDTQFFTRRAVVFIAIIGLHVFIIWAFASGLARRAIETIAPPLQTDIVEEVTKHDEPPPPPPPQMERPPVEIPPPEVSIDLPVETTSTAIQDVTDKPVQRAPPPPPAPRAVARVLTKPGKGFPNTEDYYPPSSKRLGEEGTVTVHVCTGANGKLTEEPTVAKTSGNARLDEGAVKLAKAGSGHYTPGTEDGQAATTCNMFNIKFELRN